MSLDPPPFRDIHTIRLRGPWQIEPLERFERNSAGLCERLTKNLPPATRVTMPADWATCCGPAFLGRVRYRRTFHQPTGLEPHERVFLIVEPARSHAAITLDDHSLGEVVFGDPPGRFEITALSTETMQLEIVVSHPMLDERGVPIDDSGVSRPGGLVGEVRLEIED